MARQSTQIVVSTGAIDHAIRVVVRLPAALADLPAWEQDRVIHDAMWQATEAATVHLRTGDEQGVSVRRVAVA